MPHERPDLAAAILGGGRARRFGGLDKSRLPVQGHPIINRQIEILQQLTPHLLVIAADAARFADLPVLVVPDLIPGAGALGGIYTALESAPAARVIVVGCDLPFLHAGLLGHLVDLAEGHDGAWVCTSRGPEPLLACYQRAAHGRIRQQIDAGRLKASDLGSILDLAAMGAEAVERFGPIDRLLANVNSPEDYARLEDLELPPRGARRTRSHSD